MNKALGIVQKWKLLRQTGRNICMKILDRKFSKMIVLLVMLFTLTACGAQPLPEQFEEDKVRETAEQAVGYFNEQDFQSIIDMGNEEFRELLTAEEFASQSDPYLEKCGAFQEISKTIFLGNVDKETQAAYGGVVMVGSYEEGTIQFTIAFTEDMELIQFLIR